MLMNALLNILGIVLVFACLYLFSYNRSQIKFRQIGRCLILHFCIAVVWLKVPAGIWLVTKLGDGVTTIISYAKEGLLFVFGSLSLPTGASGFVFIVQVLGTIIFVGSLVSILAYLGILSWVIAKLGRVVGKLTGCSQLEGFISTANVFLSDTESPLLMSRYLKFMTDSEIMVMLISGMGSMSVCILGGYIAMGIPAKHLVIAAALVPLTSITISKILLPETDTPKVVENIDFSGEKRASNLIEALANGAMDGMNMVIAIAASLVAIISVVAMINGALGLINLKLEEILSWIFYPLGYFMALEPEHTQLASQLLGCKIVLTEFIPFATLGQMINSLSPRTGLMLSVAVSGFANVSSLAICVSGIAALCPEMKPTLAKYVWKGMWGGFALSTINALTIGLIMSF